MGITSSVLVMSMGWGSVSGASGLVMLLASVERVGRGVPAVARVGSGVSVAAVMPSSSWDWDWSWDWG